MSIAMLWHFVRRDFLSSRFYWSVLGGITLIAALITWRAPDAWWFLMYAYLFFAVAPMNGIAGVTWRSQHVMSRNYLLALPVKRTHLFALVQLRALVYWLPLLALSLALPLVYQPHGMRWTAPRYLSVVLTVTGLAAWAINMIIAMQLDWERIAASLNPLDRFKSWVAVLAVCALECQIAAIALLLAVSLRMGALLPIVAIFALVTVRYHVNERRWTNATAAR